MKKFILLFAFLLATSLFSACTSKKTPSVSAPAGNSASEKSGETTKTGKIISAGGSYFLETSDGQKQKLDSYSVDLSAYVNKTVTVTGQFSGDDLFVGKVE